MSSPEQPSFIAEGLGFLPSLLTADYVARRGAAKATITEILAADIGDSTSKSPHLIVSFPRVSCSIRADLYQIRTSTDDLVLYRAFHYPTRSSSDSWTKNLRWTKLPQQHLPKFTEEATIDTEDARRESSLIALGNVCGYSTVFQRGASPAFILKESSSLPRVISLGGSPVKGLTRFHTSACQRGFAYIDVDVRKQVLTSTLMC